MDDKGNEPVKDFILSQPKEAIAEIIHVFELLYRFNIRLGLPYVRKMGKSNIRELRIKHSNSLYRIFYFAYIGKKFVLLHAMIKKTEKTPEQDLQTAINRMNDYTTRYAKK